MQGNPQLGQAVNVSGFTIFNDNCINNGKIPGDPNYEEFALRVEDVTHVINRNPSVFAIPGVNQDGHGQPKIYSIDFGMLEENIILSGPIPDEDFLLNNGWLPTVRDLTRIGRQWWYNFSLSGADTIGFNQIALRTGPGGLDFEVYGFTFQNVQVSRKSGVLAWDYKMTLTVVKFPGELLPNGHALAWNYAK